MRPLVLRTKYAFHTLLWLLKPDIILDVGSMDGSDSKKFKALVPAADVIAFEANPYNYQSMRSDDSLRHAGIQVIHRLVSNQEGTRTFFVQQPTGSISSINKGTSSALRRSEQGMETLEVSLDAVRIDSFLAHDHPESRRVAMWVDVEGHAYEVLESLYGAKEFIYLIHIEVETQEVWQGQKIEKDILSLVQSMGFISVARGAHEIQRDLILINASWYNANRRKISAMLYLSKWIGPLLSKALRIEKIAHMLKCGRRFCP